MPSIWLIASAKLKDVKNPPVMSMNATMVPIRTTIGITRSNTVPLSATLIEAYSSSSPPNSLSQSLCVLSVLRCALAIGPIFSPNAMTRVINTRAVIA